MLLKRQRYVLARNISDKEQRVIDRGLSGGEIILGAGEEVFLPSDTWMRVWRLPWLQRIEPKEVQQVDDMPYFLLRAVAKDMGICIGADTKKQEIIEALQRKAQQNPELYEEVVAIRKGKKKKPEPEPQPEAIEEAEDKSDED